MKIQTRCFVGVVPVFIALVVAVGLLITSWTRKETLWSLKEEALGLAITAAELTDRAALTNLEQDVWAAGGKEAFLQPFQRVIKAGVGRRITVVAPGNGRVLLDLGPRASSNRVYRVPEAAMAALQVGEPFVSEVTRDPSWGDIMEAYTPVHGADGAPAATLVVQTDATLLRSRAADIHALVMRGAAITVAAGMLCALVIGMVLRRAVGTFTEVATAAGSARYDDAASANRGFIQEIRDLWNTFDTMISVLKGVMTKSRRDLLEVEVFRSEKDLVTAFEETYATPHAAERGGISVRMQTVGTGRPGRFMDLWEAPDRMWAVFGAVHGEPDALRSTLMASAALRFLKEGIEGGKGPAIEAARPSASDRGLMQDAGSLFAFEDLTLLAVSPEGAMTVWTLDPATSAVRKDTQTLGGPAMCFHDLGPEAAHRVALYLDYFPGGSIQELSDELSRIVLSLDPPPAGTLLLAHAK